MYQIIQNIIGWSQGSGYNSMTTYEQYCIACALTLLMILTIITCDWLKQLFKSLINRIR